MKAPPLFFFLCSAYSENDFEIMPFSVISINVFILVTMSRASWNVYEVSELIFYVQFRQSSYQYHLHTFTAQPDQQQCLLISVCSEPLQGRFTRCWHLRWSTLLTLVQGNANTKWHSVWLVFEEKCPATLRNQRKKQSIKNNKIPILSIS